MRLSKIGRFKIEISIFLDAKEEKDMIFLFCSIFWTFSGPFFNFPTCNSRFFPDQMVIFLAVRRALRPLKMVRGLARARVHQPSIKTGQLRVFATSGWTLIESQALLSAFLTIFNALKMEATYVTIIFDRHHSKLVLY